MLSGRSTQKSIARAAGAACIVSSLLLAVASAEAQQTLQPDSSGGPLSVEEVLNLRRFVQLGRVELSPDGTAVAYAVIDPSRRSWTRDDDFYLPTGARVDHEGAEIWLTDIETGASVRVSGGGGSSWAPSWSPDGRSLAYYSDHGGVAQLWIWDREHARSRVVATVPIRPFYAYERPEWTPDGTAVVVKLLPESMDIEDISAAADRSRFNPIMNRQNGDSAVVTVFQSAVHGNVRGTEHGTTPDLGPDLRRADLAVVEIASGRLRRLVRSAPIAGYWVSPGGSHVAYTLFRYAPESQQGLVDIVVTPIESPAARVLATDVPQPIGTSVSWSPDGSSIAYTTRDSSTGSGDCFVVEIAGGNPRNLTTGAHPSFGTLYRPPIWGVSGDDLLLIGGDTLWRLEPKAADLRALGAVPGRKLMGIVAADAGRELWSPGDGSWVYLWTLDQVTQKAGVARIDLTTGQTELLFEEERGYGEFLPHHGSFASDARGSVVVYLAQDARSPLDLWIARDGFAARSQLTALNPAIATRRLGWTRTLEWIGTSGDSLRGALLLPNGYQPANRYPTIVYLYPGRMGSAYVNTFGLGGAVNLQLLASRGYAVLFPDVPMSSAGNPMRDISAAVEPALDELVESEISQPDRLAALGFSYGGYGVLSLLVQSDRFTSAVSISGAYDLFSMYGTLYGNGADRHRWVEAGQGRMRGTPWQYRERYIENSPWHHLDQITTPLLLIHGEIDRAVPASQSDALFIGLRRLGRTVEYARYPQGHYIDQWSPGNTRDYLHRIINWFGMHLGYDSGERPGTVR